MSIVFIGTPQFAVPALRRLAADGHHVSAVVTQPDRPAGRGLRVRASPVKLAAEELRLPVKQPPSLRDAQAIEELASLRPEVIVAVAYGQILRQPVLDIPPRGILNVHPSLLPRWRGASPVPGAILAGDEATGVSIILMDPGMDSGPILAQRRHPIAPTDTAGSLLDTLSTVAADLLSETLPRWLAGEIEPQPQDELLATVCPLLRKESGAIHWDRPAVDIWRAVRAYNPWPGAYSALDGELLHIWRSWPLDFDSGSAPGTVVALSGAQRSSLPEGAPPGAFAVQTGEGLLAVLQAQRAGRRVLPADEFLRGLPGLIGRRLSTPE